ncbi:hypothetical protein KR51_00023910 [Rubidibacter lacunae KORDI 51-2]|uniref:N-acetyltransferase n=1 Tax=Rubidibacter lacunae KORDI 51-2 TaxID=582515 RepID=U5DJQ5_9CHRO|nr:GNAT family N-acetyltransferase [Rubidibacter lacunae]ERN41127.1 hypothetical protein KR51_00023910 [Rubidibacter lacunae KORDI 51-2]
MLGQRNAGYTASWVAQIADIPQLEWDELAAPLATPFLEWEWLHNLETSGCATPREGWQPVHLVVRRDRQLVAAAPLYVKGHSYGEFVFDHQWAELAYRLGARYYPKLLGMTPFTPAVGYRFLIAPGEDEAALTALIVAEIDRFCDREQLGGCHFLFVDPDWRSLLETLGFSSWMHHSYIWGNNNYQGFDDYLQTFNANQRRNIKKERKKVMNAGLRVEAHVGEEIPRSFYPLIYRFYSHTCDRFFSSSKYLTRQFFEQLYPNYRDRVVTFVAYPEDEPHPVGLSFCIRKGDRLYGRYWGCFEDYDCLHFEACYYKPIEWGIAQGINSFDPGAGGRHKRRRGFPATPNFSLHRFTDPRMAQILQHYIGEIDAAEQEAIDAINDELPFSKREVALDPEALSERAPSK